jgi:hypothetical protein
MSDANESTTEPTVETAPEAIEGQEALGDPGKKALDTMKGERNAARDEAKALKARLDALEAQAAGREAEHAAEIEKQRVKDEALSAANQRILRSELKAAATGKLADPADAALFVNLAEFTVSDDGDVDSGALDAAISDLLTRKPHLAAKQGRFDGSADQGGTRTTGDPAQITLEQLKSMTPEQIVAADEAGQLKGVLGVKA